MAIKKGKNAMFTTKTCVFGAINLLELARKMMNKISADIDNNQKTPPPEIYSLINILKNIPLVKQYTDSLQQKQAQKPTSCLSPDIVRQIEIEILGKD